MLGAVTRVNQPRAAISVGNHSQDLIIYKDTCSCTGRGVATAVAAATTVPSPTSLKFKVAVSIGFHKVVDPTVVTHPPVVLTWEMVAVCTDAAPPLIDVNRQLLNFIEVYEQNGSG